MAKKKPQRKRVVSIDVAAAAVPTSWLDSILSGPEAVIRRPPYGCPDIERILLAVAARVRAL